MTLSSILEKAVSCPHNLSRREMVFLLQLSDEPEKEQLFQAAYRLKLKYSGATVSLRGLIEMGNICSKNCLYCGIRSSNSRIQRYRLSADDVVRMAKYADDLQYGSVVIQSGEIEMDRHTEEIEEILHRIRDFSGGKMGVTLSLGEQTEEVYRRWFQAGAHRYLLRIETSNPALYAELHPSNHSYVRRKECLDILKRCGYQVGTGVMIGLPGQTLEDLADDILFFAAQDADMIGMGPWLPHPDTPLGKDFPDTADFRFRQLESGLKMIAVTRLFLHDTNIAATTALQTLAANGRERGLLAGANVIMPNITDTAYRGSYQLYTGKPDCDENAPEIRRRLTDSITEIGETINWSQHGDSPHYFKRIAKS